MGGHRRALHRVRLQPEQAERKRPAQIPAGPGVASWKGRWAASPAGADFQAIVAAMLEQKGEAATLEWLKAMKTNASAYRGNSAVLKAVNAGQIDSGVIYHYYSFVDQSKTGENSKNTAALLQTPGSGCVCQHLRRRAGFQQAQGTSPGLPEVDHRQGRPGGAQERQFVRIRRRPERPIQPQAGATAAIGRAKGRCFETQQQKAVELMTQAGLL
jgi:iron(III) transport system substrate-binding protein